jgi:hypothetical protein
VRRRPGRSSCRRQGAQALIMSRSSSTRPSPRSVRTSVGLPMTTRSPPSLSRSSPIRATASSPGMRVVLFHVSSSSPSVEGHHVLRDGVHPVGADRRRARATPAAISRARSRAGAGFRQDAPTRPASARSAASRGDARSPLATVPGGSAAVDGSRSSRVARVPGRWRPSSAGLRAPPSTEPQSRCSRNASTRCVSSLAALSS